MHNLGEEVTADSIALLPPKVRKDAFGALAYYNKKNPNDKTFEMDVTDDKTRREVLARYCIDAGEGKLGVCAKKTVFNENKKTGVGRWLHEEQIAHILKSEKLAAMQIKELPSQPSSIKEAAAQ